MSTETAETEIALDDTLTALIKKFGDDIRVESGIGDPACVVPVAKLVEIATWLRDDPSMTFNLPAFMTCIDRLGQPLSGGESLDAEDPPRFEVVYQLRSLSRRCMIRLKVISDDDPPTVPTLSGLWKAFNWLERECYDMYGVNFDGHPDQRRIYMYEQFVGHPLRKDYPKDKRQPLVRRDWSDEVTDF